MTINEQERLYEYGLPGYLQNDLDAFKDGLGNGSTLMDCLWGELYGSINIAEINEVLSRPNTQTICGRNSSGDKRKPP